MTSHRHHLTRIIVLTALFTMACRSSTTDVTSLAGLTASTTASLTCEPHGPRIIVYALRRGEKCEMKSDDWELVLYRTPSGRGHHVQRTWTTTDSLRWRGIVDSVGGAIEAADSLTVCRQGHQTVGGAAAYVTMWRHPDYIVGLSSTTRPGDNPFVPYHVILHSWSMAQWSHAADSTCASQLALE
jgi:hypothetical protein